MSTQPHVILGPRTIHLGNWKLHLVSDGRFWLDGGAMFGVIPKPLWSRVIACDERNRIPLGLNCLLIQTGESNILVDTGIGTKEDAKAKEIYRMEPAGILMEQLAAVGVSPGDIDWVINTHLHFDHCGGNTARVGNTERPAFPNATFFVQAGEMHDARNSNERNRASYLPRNWESIGSKWELLQGDVNLARGISVFETPGHTAHHQSVRVEKDGKTVVFLADVMPTIHHISLPWIMGYDLYPMTTLESKRKLLPRMVDENWLLIFEHEAFKPVGRVVKDAGKHVFVEEL